MAIIKISKKESRYFSVEKHCIENTSLSWQARGLHCFLMSKPDNWQIIISNLINSGPSGKNAIYSMLKELKEAGFIIERKETDPKTKRFTGNVYEVFEMPQTIIKSASGKTKKIINSGFSFPGTGNTGSGNPPLINIDINNNKNNNQEPNLENEKKETLEYIENEGLVEGYFFENIDSPKCKIEELGNIGTSLTQAQTEFFELWKTHMAQSTSYRVSNPHQVATEVHHTLLDYAQLVGCENNFYRKLAAIDKLIMTGKWKTPFKLQKRKSASFSKNKQKGRGALSDLDLRLKDTNQKIHELQTANASDKNFVASLETNHEGNSTHMQAISNVKHKIQQRCADIESLIETLQSIRAEQKRISEAEDP